MPNRGHLLILELTSQRLEGRSEGNLLYELMKILDYEDRVIFPSTLGKGVFLDKLANAEQEYIHISTHGSYGVRGTSLQVQRKRKGRYMKIKASDISSIWEDRDYKPELTVLSACHAGHRDMIDSFTEAGCNNIIAPIRETNWDYAALFSALFYKSLLGDGRHPWKAYTKAWKGMNTAFPNTSGKWRFYKKGTYCPIF